MNICNRRGFTLVELLAVIAILGVMATIAIGGVSKILRDSRHKMFCEKAESIEAAAKSYAQDYNEEMVFSGEESMVSVQTLLNRGYLREDSKGKKNVDDPRNGSSMLSIQITVKRINGRYYGFFPDKKSVCN